MAFRWFLCWTRLASWCAVETTGSCNHNLLRGISGNNGAWSTVLACEKRGSCSGAFPWSVATFWFRGVLSLTVICHLSNKASFSIDIVGTSLHSAIRESYRVGTSSLGTITFFLMYDHYSTIQSYYSKC